ncbi:MAG: GyrI-like domain-containing protein [Bdellovibrionota bacterium]
MNTTKTQLEEFYVMGLQIRTTNAVEMTSAGKIPSLWGKFYSEQIASQISGKIEDSVFAVYSDYASDMNGEYSLTIGFKVKADVTSLPGLHIVRVPAQTYMKYTTDIGEMPNIVIDGWKHIWNQTQSSELKRKYSADFEVYDHRCADLKKSQVDIFICI